MQCTIFVYKSCYVEQEDLSKQTLTNTGPYCTLAVISAEQDLLKAIDVYGEGWKIAVPDIQEWGG